MFRAMIIGMTAAAAFGGTAFSQDVPTAFDGAARLTAEALSQHRGGSPDPVALVNQAAPIGGGGGTVSVFGNTTSANTIADTFVDSSGIFTVVQNTGNNVIIQTGVAVAIEMVP